MKEQQVILVNEKDESIGTMAKLEAHQKGVLHRAFSIFIFDSRGHFLLQKRSGDKYHGGNLWTNACCSHPYPDEDIMKAASRRLLEELGFQTNLEEIFSFTYHAAVENNLIEHEFDHVFAGFYEGPVFINLREVSEYSYESIDQIKWAIEHQPSKFTTWFKIAFPEIESWWKKRYASK